MMHIILRGVAKKNVELRHVLLIYDKRHSQTILLVIKSMWGLEIRNGIYLLLRGVEWRKNEFDYTLMMSFFLSSRDVGAKYM